MIGLDRLPFKKWSILNLSFLSVCLFTIGCAIKPQGYFMQDKLAKAPDYSNLEYWAAHPEKHDYSDSIPAFLLGDTINNQADVFFIHPTTFTQRAGINIWNADLLDKKLNKKTDETTILYQSSIFNASGVVFAPRYRQAHLGVFYTRKIKEAKAALELAYADVRMAFEYYLQNYNNGRPIIIASHSQGALHGRWLLKDYFDGKELSYQLVAAYLIGYPTPKEYFEHLGVCTNAEQIGCVCSWRTFKKGHYPKKHLENKNSIIVNPLSWTTDDKYMSKKFNMGGVLKDFNRKFANLADAKIHDGLLWIEKPKFPGSFLFFRNNYHVGDLNLYYVNVRMNAINRLENYLQKTNN